MNTRTMLRAAGACGLAAASFASQADCAGSGLLLRAGAHDLIPGSSTSTAIGNIGVQDRIGPTFNIDYRFCEHYVIDVLAALPFTQDLTLNGARVGSTQHLPPTVSIQYHALPGATIDPYFGIGLNHTMFRNESLDSGARLKLDNTWGYAAQLGVDWNFAPRWLVGVDGRFIQIEPKAHVNGGDIGKVKINPVAVGITVGYRY